MLNVDKNVDDNVWTDLNDQTSDSKGSKTDTYVHFSFNNLI